MLGGEHRDMDGAPLEGVPIIAVARVGTVHVEATAVGNPTLATTCVHSV